MKKVVMLAVLLCGLFLSFGAEAQQAQAPIKTQTTWRGQSINDYYKYVGPDFDLQLGAGYRWDTGDKQLNSPFGMGRFRMGVLWVPTWPWAISTGFTAETTSLPTMSWGVQTEALHLGSGFWARGGVALDYYGRPHGNMGLGWSLFGAELHGFSPGVSNRPEEGVALMATFRVPLGFLIYVMTKQ